MYSSEALSESLVNIHLEYHRGDITLAAENIKSLREKLNFKDGKVWNDLEFSLEECKFHRRPSNVQIDLLLVNLKASFDFLLEGIKVLPEIDTDSTRNLATKLQEELGKAKRSKEVYGFKWTVFCNNILKPLSELELKASGCLSNKSREFLAMGSRPAEASVDLLSLAQEALKDLNIT